MMARYLQGDGGHHGVLVGAKPSPKLGGTAGKLLLVPPTIAVPSHMGPSAGHRCAPPALQKNIWDHSFAPVSSVRRLLSACAGLRVAPGHKHHELANTGTGDFFGAIEVDP